jgi:hypothetical protein
MQVLNKRYLLVTVVHTCNPSYSGGTDQEDQEDHGSKQAGANSSQDPISKTPITKKEMVE